MKSTGWRQRLCAQCPLGPDTYVRAMAEKLVEEDFDELYRQEQDNDIGDRAKPSRAGALGLFEHHAMTVPS